MVKPVGAWAAYYTLTPSSGSYASGTEFTVDLGINPATDKVLAADVLGTFDSSKLELVSIVAKGTVFSVDNPTFSNTAGTFSAMLTPASGDPYSASSTTVDVATLTFKPIAAGSATVNLTCAAGSFDDSNIFNESSEDIITCASNQSGIYTITAVGGEETSTAEPTTGVVETTTATTTSSELPQTGSLTMIIAMSLIGMIGMAGAFMLKAW